LAANEGAKVKTFLLAFGSNADRSSLGNRHPENEGLAARIYEGFRDAVTQMETFYLQELGMIMLSDFHVEYQAGNIQFMDSTVSQLPVLADRSEIVVDYEARLRRRFPLSRDSKTIRSFLCCEP
jgi:hypothetical protein